MNQVDTTKLGKLASPDGSPPPEGDRRLDRADALRRLRREPGLEALVPELLDPGQVGLRGEPADAARRSAPASGRRTSSSSTRPATRRRAPRSRLRWRARPEAMPGSRTSSYFSTHDLMYVSQDRHTTFEEIYPPGPSTFSTTSGAAGARRGGARAAGRDPGRGHGPRPARGGEHARRAAAATSSSRR